MTSDNLFMIPEQKLLNEAGEFQLDEETLKALEERAQQQLQEEAMRRMLEAQANPQEQNYIQRLDTKDLVKTDEEYAKCLAQNVPMRTVRYMHALQILAEADARRRQKIKKRKARKVTKASRKRNR